MTVCLRTLAVLECIWTLKQVSSFIFMVLGCINKSFNKVWSFFVELTEEFAVILFTTGLFLTFFGAKYPSVTLFLAGCFAASVFSLVLLKQSLIMLGYLIRLDPALFHTRLGPHGSLLHQHRVGYHSRRHVSHVDSTWTLVARWLARLHPRHDGL